MKAPRRADRRFRHGVVEVEALVEAPEAAEQRIADHGAGGVALLAKDLRQRELLPTEGTGNAVTDPTLCQVRITNDWLELMGQEPNRARVTIGVVDGMITLWDHRGLRSPGDEAVARFEDWTRRLHHVEAALMWDGEASVTPIFTEESARLHLQLGEEFITQGSS